MISKKTLLLWLFSFVFYLTAVYWNTHFEIVLPIETLEPELSLGHVETESATNQKENISTEKPSNNFLSLNSQEKEDQEKEDQEKEDQEKEDQEKEKEKEKEEEEEKFGGWDQQTKYWKANSSDLFGIHSYRCNIPRIPLGSITDQEFRDRYQHFPVIFYLETSDKQSKNEENRQEEKREEENTGKQQQIDYSQRNQRLREQLTKENLLELLGEEKVVLSSANAQSYEKIKIPFSDYVDQMMVPWEREAKGAERFYLFGDNAWKTSAAWRRIAEFYEAVPLFDAQQKQSLSFGMGGSGSGVPFHTHGPVFAELFYGAKRWWFYPPDTTILKQYYDGDESSLQWLYRVYLPLFGPLAFAEASEQDFLLPLPLPPPLECTCYPSEILWVPSGWFHSTLNIGETIFLSAFV
jgi:archaellum component FlaD/FlaE